jgi:hypothetical protein
VLTLRGEEAAWWVNIVVPSTSTLSSSDTIEFNDSPCPMSTYIDRAHADPRHWGGISLLVTIACWGRRRRVLKRIRMREM